MQSFMSTFVRPNAKHWVVVHVEVQARPRVNELIHEDRLIRGDVGKAVVTGHNDVDFVDEVGFGELVEEVAHNMVIACSHDPEGLLSIRTLREYGTFIMHENCMRTL